MRRKGMMKGRGKGYKNVMGKDPYVHSQSAKGIKQPQKVHFIPEPFGLPRELQPKDRFITEQNRKILFDYVPKWESGNIKTGFFHFEKLPLSKAKQLLTGEPNVEPNDTQNDSPSMKDMVNIVENYGGTLEGYAVEPTRTDARITFEGFTINVNQRLAKQIADRYQPDEFDKISENKYRFWWD